MEGETYPLSSIVRLSWFEEEALSGSAGLEWIVRFDGEMFLAPSVASIDWSRLPSNAYFMLFRLVSHAIQRHCSQLRFKLKAQGSIS